MAKHIAHPGPEQLPLGQISPSEVFGRIRNFLAGRHVGATRDRALLDQVLLCLFAKLHALRAGAPISRAGGLTRCYSTAIRQLQETLPVDCLPDASLTLDAASLEYVDYYLSLLDLRSNATDLVGDAYQCFLGSESRGQEGQFFTPSAAVNILIACIDPQPGERVIDPAAGSGGFLFAAAHHLARHGSQPRAIARSLFGIEKDAYLARLARMRLSLITLCASQVTVGDSLAWLSSESDSFMLRRKPGAFDVVLTNPPFGAKIVAASDTVRRQFSLAYRWSQRSADAALQPTASLMTNTPPQVLFVERCLSLVRPGGRIGMVVPESLVSGKNYRHVVEFITRSSIIDAVIGMPEALFKTSGRGGTHTKTVLLCLKKLPAPNATKAHSVFMAEAAWCGHDSRGRSIPKNDAPRVIENWQISRTRPVRLAPTPLGYLVPFENIKPGVLAPRAYDPLIPTILSSLRATHLLVRTGDLLKKRTVSVSTGDEVGKLAYGTGDIPFVRTSDLSNWEIKLDPKHGVSRRIYEELRTKQDVQPGDILMVRDGTYLIGTCAIVTKYDAEMVFQSHIYKLRVHPNDLIDEYLLLAVLSSPIVQRQIKSQTQTQDIINSLGTRLFDIILPIPRSAAIRQEISQSVQRVIRERSNARELARQIAEGVASPP